MRGRLAVSALAVAVTLASNSARAQQNPPAPAGNPEPSAQSDAALDDIIVTAQKRSESVNKVPLAISAIGADELASRGISDTAQLSKLIPSFTVLKSGYGQPIFYIRGIGFSNVTVSISPAVSIYTDEVPLPFSTMARGAAFDLERVEVLKGPQGTLFGQNSTGGAVNYIVAKPTNEMAAGIDLEAGRFGAVNATAFVSGPLSDTLRARIAVQSRYQDDWQRSLSRPGDERGEQRFLNGRAIIDWNPSSALRFELTGSAWQDKSDNQAPQFLYFAPARTGPAANPVAAAALSPQVRAPNDSRAADWDAGSRTARDDRFYQATLRADYQAGWATITSLTAYSDAKVDSPVELDGTPFANAYFVQNARLKTFSQELRIAGEAGSRIRWLVGGNYQHAKTDEFLNETLNSTNNIVGPFTYTQIAPFGNQNVSTIAGFASFEYKLADKVTVRASGRYTSEKRDYSGCLADAGDGKLAGAFGLVSSGLVGRPVTIAPGACITFDDTTKLPLPIINKSLNENNFSWRAGVDWQANADTLLYANIAKGFKSGGFTVVPAVFANQLTPVTQESVLTYEAGLKISLFDRRVHLNLAGFYYDYKNKQLQGFVNIAPFGPLPTLVNVPTSRVYGGEADMTARVTKHLTLKVSGAYLNTRATSAPTVPTGPLGGLYDFSGESFPDTPKYQATADLEQRVPVGGGAEAYVGASAQYRSSASGVFGSSQNALTRSLFTIDAYTLIDLRAGVSFNDNRLTAEIWGRNITDKFYEVGVTRTVDVVHRYVGMPATYGVRLSWRY